MSEKIDSSSNEQPQETDWSTLEEPTKQTKTDGWESLAEPATSQEDSSEASEPAEETDEPLSTAEQHEAGETVHETIDIDYGGMLQMEITSDGDEVQYQYILNSGELKLGQNIIHNLRTITHVEQSPEDSDVSRIELNDTIFVDVNRKTGKVEIKNKLTSFELRLLAQGTENGVPFSREKLGDFKPETDLHTHFAGALTPDMLIKVGLEHDISYPLDKLRQMGATGDYEADEKGNVKLSDISPIDLEIMKNRLKLSQITQETFNKMEEIYDLRGPFTKNPELFGDYLRELAKDYQRNGIKYTELSFSAFLSNPEYMRQMEKVLPEIEAQTGVKIRFIAGLWRHSDPEWNQDETDRLMQLAKSPYIAGCDFMGQETNETTNFEDELRALARHCMEEDPMFSIRVHAGENPIFPDNVKSTLQIIHSEWRKACEEKGTNLPMPRVRIGHGLYGVDDETIQLAKEMGVIIEFNMSSNLALNNINGIKDVPIKKYIDAGVDVVLGTDGHGLYTTIGEQEAILATVAGLGPEDFAKIHATEQKIQAAAEQREKTRTEHDESVLYDVHYDTPDGKPRWNQEVEQHYQEQRAAADHMVEERLSGLGITTNPAEIERVTADKIPILITGASKSSWPEIAPQDQRNISLAMQVLANVINPETAYVVTGGTNFGAEKTMHEAVHRRNAESEDQLVLLGTLTMEAAKEGGTAGIEADTITHAQILEVNGRRAQSWLDLPDTQLEYVRQRSGLMIALGGGSVVSNMIQRGHNTGTRMLLMDGPKGASTEKSRSLRGNGYSFKTAEELIMRLYQEQPEIFKPDFKPEDIPALIAQAEAEI